MPEISVVIPIYNVEPYLNRCVDSILNQTYSNFQLILVDDGSPDNCGQICDEYAKNDARIHVIHRENGGLSAARNSGIDWVFDNSFTEWITFIDSDDWVHKDYLKKLYEANIYNKTNISVCNSTFAYDDNAYTEYITDFKKTSPEEFWIKNKGNAVVAWGKLYLTKLFYEIRYPVGKLQEDEFTTHKLLFTQNYLSVTSSGLYMYYQSPNSIMRAKWNNRRLDGIDAFCEQLIFFKKKGYKKAYKQVEFQLINAIDYYKKEITSTNNKEANIQVMNKKIQDLVYRRYNNRILSSKMGSTLYINSLRIYCFISLRLKAIKNKIKTK